MPVSQFLMRQMIVDVVFESGRAARVGAGWRPRTMEVPSGMISLVQTSNRRDWPKATELSYWSISLAPSGIGRYWPIGLS